MSKKKGIKKGSAQAATFAVQKEIDRQLWTMQVIKYIKQECIDAAQIALSNRFTFGPQRQAAFLEEFSKCFDEICHTKLQDTDDQFYSDSRIEGRLKEINGDKYIPKKERYSFTVTDALGRTHSYNGVQCEEFL